MTTAFVILHYRTFEITVSCLEQLFKVAPDSPIVVVDNGSGDGSGEALREKFGGRVAVLINEDNLGFARGNNTGYKYVKEHYKADCVVVMNNDVIITQPDFTTVLASYMKENDLDVCGPDIVTPDDKHQNPMFRKPFSTFRILKQMAIDIVRIAMLKLHLFERRILSTYTTVSNSFQKQDVADLSNITDCILHGSCIAYSSNYLSKEDFAFVPVTFLYGEEMILFDYCQRKKYRTGVCISAQVTHLGGRTIMNGSVPREKQIFKAKQTVKSLWQLVKLRLFKS